MWYGERNVTAEVVAVSLDRSKRPWLKLRVVSATGHRAGELAPEIRRSLKTVKEGEARFHRWQARRARSRKVQKSPGRGRPNQKPR
ncbi:hypothetical protein ACFFIH_25300, partial [Rhizorhabdus histidinilytica]